MSQQHTPAPLTTAVRTVLITYFITNLCHSSEPHRPSRCPASQGPQNFLGQTRPHSRPASLHPNITFQTVRQHANFALFHAAGKITPEVPDLPRGEMAARARRFRRARGPDEGCKHRPEWGPISPHSVRRSRRRYRRLGDFPQIMIRRQEKPSRVGLGPASMIHRRPGKHQTLRLDLSLGADNPRVERAGNNFHVGRHPLGISEDLILTVIYHKRLRSRQVPGGRRLWLATSQS
jgi:hypothetical protein